MREYPYAGRASEMQRRGYTLIELFAVIFIVTVPVLAFQAVAPRFGSRAGMAVALASAAASVAVVVAIYWMASRLHEQTVRELSQKYPLVYRVIALPTDDSCVVKADGTEIAIGDFGWEAEPVHEDGLIYLHGLTVDWQVAWYAGFRREQLEPVGPKPRLQYYLPYSWVAAGATPPSCPFSVVTPPTVTLGHPQQNISGWVQGRFVQRKRMF